MTRLGITVDYADDFARSATEVTEFERAGIDVVAVAEAYSFDAVSRLGYLAAITERVTLMSAILPVYSRTPALIAMTALAEQLGTTEAYARRAIGDALNFKLMPEGLSASEAGMRRVFVTLQSAGLVPKDAAFDMADLVDGSYLAAAR